MGKNGKRENLVETKGIFYFRRINGNQVGYKWTF